MHHYVSYSKKTLSSSVRLGLCFLLMSVFGCSEPAQQSSVESPDIEPDDVVSVQVQKPNIVFILLDDLGWQDVGFNGSDIATPNLDQMANAGVRLNRNYVYPICSPTRTALLTGHSPLEYGVDGPMGDHTGLPVDVRIMPQYLKELGYQTYMVGKWHQGIGNTDYFPHSRGFDYFYGFLGGWVDFYTHVYNESLDWQRNGVSVREDGHATSLLTQDAQRVITERDKDKPFFLYLSYNAPHSPLQILPESTGLNETISDSDRKVYAEMVTDTDRGIGAVVDTLKSEGVLDDTIIVFSSDNGGALDLGSSNGELRGGKGELFEGGMRVPGLIWWPGVVEGGRLMEQQIVSHDWLPTLLQASGADLSVTDTMYGQSMWPAIADNKTVERRETTIGVVGSFAIFDWPWKLVDYTARGTTEPRYVELYNIQNDPNESNDLAAQNPEIVAKLSAIRAGVPEVPSRRSKSKPPEAYFKNEDGSWNYEVRMIEKSTPYAEAAVKGFD